MSSFFPEEADLALRSAEQRNGAREALATGMPDLPVMQGKDGTDGADGGRGAA